MYFECLPVLQTQERELYILAHLIPMGTTQGNVLWGGGGSQKPSQRQGLSLSGFIEGIFFRENPQGSKVSGKV